MGKLPLTNVPIRPLNKGMYRNLPPNGIPMGGFLRSQNYRILEAGLERRHGLVNFDENNEGLLDSAILDVINFYRRSAENQTLYLTEKSLFRRGGTSLTKFNITYTGLTIDSSTDGNEITIVFTDTGDLYVNLRTGDTIETVEGDFTIDAISISELAGVYTFTIGVYSSSPLAIDDLVGDASITYNFKSVRTMTPSYALLPVEDASNDDSIIIADQADRGFYKYNTTGSLELYPIDSSTGGAITPVYTNLITGRTVAYFADRMWTGNTIEIDGEHRQRIRWSDVRTFNRFQFENYVDLPYTEGQLLALKPLGSLLVAYFEDAVYFGRATNIASLPYYFTRMETGLVGPVCDRAITTWVDKHYFVGDDDIYTMSEATGLVPIGAPIVTESIEWANNLNRELKTHVKAVHDLDTESVAFLIPDYYDVVNQIPGLTERIWRYFYKTGSWSYDEVHFADTDKKIPDFLYLGMASSRVYLYGKSWEEWQALDPSPTGDSTTTDSDITRWIRESDSVPTDETFDDYPTWNALINEDILPRSMKMSIYKVTEDRIILAEESKGMEQDNLLADEYPIWGVLESPDYDLGMPDATKTFNRLSMKSYQNRVDRYTGASTQLDQVNFILYSSTDMGHSYKRPRALNWRLNYNEGKADFRATGSTYRFKVVSDGVVPSYKLSEIVIRVVDRGLQIQV